jgi:hypothetical protein
MGQLAVDSLGSKQWAVDSRQLMVGSKQWAVDSGQWIINRGQWALEFSKIIFYSLKFHEILTSKNFAKSENQNLAKFLLVKFCDLLRNPRIKICKIWVGFC